MSETISVVVPTYNAAASLPKAIDSVRIQNWPDLEIIVVDDGSTDETAIVLKSLASPDLQVIRQHNGGPGAARNKAIKAAGGKWIAFLDVDDLWLPHKLALQMDRLREDPSTAFAYGDSLWQSSNGALSEQKSPSATGNLFADLLLGPQFVLSTAVVRRDCFDRVGLFESEFRTGEDWDFWLRLSSFYRGCYIPVALAVYHVSNDPDKYPPDMHERCQLRILSRLFSNPEIARVWPKFSRYRRRLCSWHYAVLAKSHLHRRQASGFIKFGAASIFSHPFGLYFLARRWNTAERMSKLAGILSRGIQ
jgi:glycosyltransferase involved in cell wall biosynthesis